MSIKITSDSTCDLSKEIIDKHNISLFSLHINMGGKSFRDCIDIVQDDIFKHVETGGDISTTAALSPSIYEEGFEKYLKDYDTVIHISLGSGFSSSYENAVAASENLGNVYVIDSENLSSGHGMLVYEACLMVEQGLRPEEIVEKLNEIKKRIHISFVLDRLDYMKKGGRCSSVVEIGANLLRLKLQISVIDNKMKVTKKYRGNFEKCMKKYVHEMLDNRDDIELDKVFIAHPHADEHVLDMVKETIRECAHFDEITETRAGCTVSCHCGPNTIGIVFKTK